MSGPFPTWLGNQRVIALPISQQQYDTVTVTTTGVVNFTVLLPAGANSQAAQRVQAYVMWLTVTPNTFPAAAAGGTGFLRVEALDGGGATLVGPLNMKAFSWTQFNNGVMVPYVYTPPNPLRRALVGAALATVANIRFSVNITAILGAPSALVEIGTAVDQLNTGPLGTFGGNDVLAQGANNPNAF